MIPHAAGHHGIVIPRDQVDRPLKPSQNICDFLDQAPVYGIVFEQIPGYKDKFNLLGVG